jgi:Fe-S cluster assembly protein SufD
MTKRVVVSRRQRTTKAKDFTFTKKMVPSQNGSGALFVQEHRDRAWKAFESLPLPHTKLEPWRRTDIRKLDVGSFKLPDASAAYPPVPEEILRPLAGESHEGQIIITPNGIDITPLSEELREKGVVFTDFATAEREYPDLLQKALGKAVSPEDGKFAALTAAMAKNGVFVYVPRNVQVEQPLQSVLWAPGVGLAHFAHLLVYVEDGASLTYVHETSSPDETGGQTLTGLNIELFVGTNAQLRFVELQTLGGHVWNFVHERAKVGRDGNMDWIFGTLGSELTKTFSDLDLIGDGSNGRMSGFYFPIGKQHLDQDTQQNHLAPHTTSDLLFKGALRQNSRSVWQGMIYCAPSAQKIDGYQVNRNLLLDDTARGDSIPGLEILADDVRCTHGTTVGNIDEELVYYLMTRGVERNDAERLIVDGFFDPIMARIPFEGVRERFAQAIQDKLA